VRVDFYHLTRDPAEGAVAAIARNTLKAGERLLVVSGDPGQRERIGRALWSLGAETFMANGEAGQGHEARQPVLLSAEAVPANGARFMALADGQWRDGGEAFARTFFLFDESVIQPARDVWRSLRNAGGRELHYWKQEGGRWIEAG